jgi:hypothetical protein
LCSKENTYDVVGALMKMRFYGHWWVYGEQMLLCPILCYFLSNFQWERFDGNGVLNKNCSGALMLKK